MWTVTFIGYKDGHHDDLKETVLWGERFQKGKPRSIDDEKLAFKASCLAHFEVIDENAQGEPDESSDDADDSDDSDAAT